MENKKIKVYNKLNNIEETREFLAIKNDNIIKYIDLENNKMIVNMDEDIIERENKDYCFVMDFKNEMITIEIKKLHKKMVKSIKTMNISKEKRKYYIKYLLTDENIINEYYVNF